MATVVVLWSCVHCARNHIAVHVEERGEEPIQEWLLGKVATAVSISHGLMSPKCEITRISEIRAPVGKISGVVGRR